MLKGIYGTPTAAGGPTARRRRSSPPASRCRGRSRPSSCWPRSGASRPSLVGDVVDRAAPRRPWRPRSTTCSTRPTSRRVPYVTQALAGVEGPFVAVSDWMRAVPDQIRPGSPATAHARRRRLRLLRHPPGRPPVLPRGRAVDRGRRPHCARQARRGSAGQGDRSGAPLPPRRRLGRRPADVGLGQRVSSGRSKTLRAHNGPEGLVVSRPQPTRVDIGCISASESSRP